MIRFGDDPADAKITVAMLSDALDLHGLRNQTLAALLEPVSPGARAIGYAKTARFVPTLDISPEKPYDAAIDFIDSAAPGELLVIATEQSNASAFWGELFSAAAKGRQVAGMITDGNLRDVEKIRALNFPAFARSHRPVDFKGRMVLDQTNDKVKILGVEIAPGDLVAADEDGVAVVPKENLKEVLLSARDRAKAESVVLEELLAGSTLREVWTRHGIL